MNLQGRTRNATRFLYPCLGIEKGTRLPPCPAALQERSRRILACVEDVLRIVERDNDGRFRIR